MTLPESFNFYTKEQADAKFSGGGGGATALLPIVDLADATSHVYDWADVPNGTYTSGTYTDGFSFTVESGSLTVLDGKAWFAASGSLYITLPATVTIPNGQAATRFSVEVDRPDVDGSSAGLEFRFLEGTTSQDGIFLQVDTTSFNMQAIPGDNAPWSTVFSRVAGSGPEHTTYYFISLPKNAIIGTDFGAQGVFAPRTNPESLGSSALNTIKVVSGGSYSGDPLKMSVLRVDNAIEVTNVDSFPAVALGSGNPFWPGALSATQLKVPFLPNVDVIEGVKLDNQGNITFSKSLGAFCSAGASAGVSSFVVSYNASNADTMVVGAKMYNRYGDWLGDVTSVSGSGSTRTIGVASLFYAVPAAESVYFRPTPTILNSVDVGAKLSRSLTVAGTVRPSQSVTGSRPSAVTSGAGAMHYDTTLSKPIWSDGTVWRDAAGTSV